MTARELPGMHRSMERSMDRSRTASPSARRSIAALIAKDARAAVAPLGIAALLAAASLVPWARAGLSDIDLLERPGTEPMLATARAVLRAATVGCAVLPAWSGVETAFLESGPGRRSMLAAMPASRAWVVASKFAVVGTCAALVAASGAAAEAVLGTAAAPSPGAPSIAPWLCVLAACAALSGLGSPTIARNRVAGFALALALPAAIAGAAWTFGAGAWPSSAVAFAGCAILSWKALPALVGATEGNPRRLWHRHASTANGAGDEPGRSGAGRRALAALLAKDARAIRPLVILGIVVIAGVSLLALSLPVYGERVMVDLGIRSSDPVSRRLAAAIPVALLVQFAVPAASALVLAFCDGRAAGRPLGGLPVRSGTVVASKAIACLSVLALFAGISIALLEASSTDDPSLGGRLMSAGGRRWAFLLLCASAIPWCLALPAFVVDRRRAAIAAVIGVPLTLAAAGVAMQWSIEGWHGLVNVRLLGVQRWPYRIDVSNASFGRFPPFVAAWAAAGIAACWAAAPAIAGTASTVRVRAGAARALAIAAVCATALGSLAYAWLGFGEGWAEYRARSSWERQVRAAMEETSLEALVRDVVSSVGELPADPRAAASRQPVFGASDAQAVQYAIFGWPGRAGMAWWGLEWTRPQLRQTLDEMVARGDSRYGEVFGNPRSHALALLAARDPAAVEAEIRRVVDDPRSDAAVRIAAAAWLGPVNTAMVAAEVVANSPSCVQRAFATAVLARCAEAQQTYASERPFVMELVQSPDSVTASGDPWDPEHHYCVMRAEAINSLIYLELRVRDPGSRLALAGKLGLRSACTIDLATVARARERLERGPSDLCEVLRAINDAPAIEPFEPADVVAAACDCLQATVR